MVSRDNLGGIWGPPGRYLVLKLEQMGVPWGAFGAAKRIASFCYPFGAVSQSALSRSGSCCKPVCCYRIPKSPIPNPKSQIHLKKKGGHSVLFMAWIFLRFCRQSTRIFNTSPVLVSSMRARWREGRRQLDIYIYIYNYISADPA